MTKIKRPVSSNRVIPKIKSGGFKLGAYTMNKIKHYLLNFSSFINQNIKGKLISDIKVFTRKQSEGSSDLLAHQDVFYRPKPTWTRALIISISGSIGFAFLYACIARIDEVVVARGELQAFGAERPIKALSSAIVSSIVVSEGEDVNKGQLLLKFDSEVNDQRKISLINEQIFESRRKHEQEKAFEAKVRSLESKLNSLEITYDLQKRIVERLSPLVEQGAISLVDYLKQRNRLQELLGEIAQTKANLSEVDAQTSTVRNSIQREIYMLDRKIAEAYKASEHEELRSPVQGRVFDLVPASPGYIASSGETLMKIVPHGALEAKVFITNVDIGFVKPQMPAQIRVDAYPFTQFGHISGKLKSIGEEVLPANDQLPEPHFPAYVMLDSQFLENDGRRYEVRSGQSVSVNLVVRDKPVISLLTDAVEKALDALRGVKSKKRE